MAETFKTVEELDARIAANQPMILNQTSEPKPKQFKASEQKSGTRSGLSELEQQIVRVLITLGKAKPAEVYRDLNATYPERYTSKQITNKMWAMEKKHVLGKYAESGAYYVESGAPEQ